AYVSGGTPLARKTWDVLVKQTPALGALVASEDPADQNKWGPVLPFHSADLPAFPLDILPTWLREYCEAITETMQTPTDLAGMLAMAILSTACARKIEVRAWSGYDEPINIYVVVAMP